MDYKMKLIPLLLLIGLHASGQDSSAYYKHINDSVHSCPIGTHWVKFLETTATRFDPSCMADTTADRLWLIWQELNCGETNFSMFFTDKHGVGLWSSSGEHWDKKDCKCIEDGDQYNKIINGKTIKITRQEYLKLSKQ